MQPDPPNCPRQTSTENNGWPRQGLWLDDNPLIKAFGENVAWIQPGGAGKRNNGVPTEEANSKTVGDEVDAEQEAKDSQKAQCDWRFTIVHRVRHKMKGRVARPLIYLIFRSVFFL